MKHYEKLKVGFYFIYYRKNESTFTTTEKHTIHCDNTKIVGHFDDEFIDIEPGQDHIVLFRRLKCYKEGDKFFIISCFFDITEESKPIVFSDAEMVRKCK